MLGAGAMGSRWIRDVWQPFRGRMEFAELVDSDPTALRKAGDWLGLPAAARFADARTAFATVDADFCCIVTAPAHHQSEGLFAACGWPAAQRVVSGRHTEALHPVGGAPTDVGGAGRRGDRLHALSAPDGRQARSDGFTIEATVGTPWFGNYAAACSAVSTRAMVAAGWTVARVAAACSCSAFIAALLSFQAVCCCWPCTTR